MKNTFYGLAVLALSSGEPVGKFAVPQESSGRPLASDQGCQPGHCVEPDVRKMGPLHVDTARSTLYQHTIYTVGRVELRFLRSKIFKFAIYLEKQLFYYAIKTRPTVVGKIG